MESIDKSYTSEYIIEKSKFLSFVYPIFSVAQANEFLSKVKSDYSDATHVCFAYVLERPSIERQSDDGEPSGTAGKPLLELLKKKKLNNVLLIVVRYFGGIKLGAGGLVRAYTTAGNMCLDMAKVVKFEKRDKYLIRADLSIGAKVLDYIKNHNGEVYSCRYLDHVEIECIVGSVEKLKDIFANIEIQIIGSVTICQ